MLPILALLLAAIAPAMVKTWQPLVECSLARTIAVGFLWNIAYWMLLAAFVAASFLLVGIPFLLTLLVAQWLLVLSGLPVLLFGLGRWLLCFLGRTESSFYPEILVGGLAVTLLRLIPVAGEIIWWIVAALASGVAIRQLLTLRIGQAPSQSPMLPAPPVSG
jgi:hypothetical protein